MPKRRLYQVLYPPFLVVLFLILVAFSVLAVSNLMESLHDAAQQKADIAAGTAAFTNDSLAASAVSCLPDDVGVMLLDDDGSIVTTAGSVPPDLLEHIRTTATRTTARNQPPGTVISPAEIVRSLPVSDEYRMSFRQLPDNRGILAVSVVPSISATARPFAAAAVLVLIGGVLLVWLASKYVVRNLQAPQYTIIDGIERFGRGDLGHRIPMSEIEEFSQFVEVANQTAIRLQSRIRNEEQQRRELESVFASMVEPVMVLDADERIVRINTAAEKVLGVRAKDAAGKNVLEVVRNNDLQRFVTWTLSSDQPVENEIVIHRDTQMILQAHGTVLQDENGDKIGGLVVLNDVTMLRQLENVRKDFVANVSHELRTPITSIKGFVETLQDGALENRDDSERFLAIVARQADRLNAILEDLLSLSRIEQESDLSEIELTRSDLSRIVRSAVQSCQTKADERDVPVEIDCPDDMTARVNPPLLEQAIVNLVDNAVKYSDAGNAVLVRVERSDTESVISVEDQGVGIPREHLPRLFERFYRVDKARSRTLGGTGLGLAIVKHIAQVHGGQATVESTPGQGSIFSIHIPRT